MVMAIDIIFVNKIPFLVTYGRGVRFGTMYWEPQESTGDYRGLSPWHGHMRVPSTAPCHRNHQCGWWIWAPTGGLTSLSFNLCAKEEHVPEIEHYIWTVKDRMQSGYNSLPFECIPCMIVICLVVNVVFWLNAFPHPGSMSILSLHVTSLPGSPWTTRNMSALSLVPTSRLMRSTQMGMEARTIGAICLGLTHGKWTGWSLLYASVDGVPPDAKLVDRAAHAEQCYSMC
jgi:hypothetical protein